MVGGAHGLTGHRALQHVVVVREQGSVLVTILHPQAEEMTVLVREFNNRSVIPQVAQVR